MPVDGHGERTPKNNKLHESMRWSHAKDFSYIQACSKQLKLKKKKKKKRNKPTYRSAKSLFVQNFRPLFIAAS